MSSPSDLFAAARAALDALEAAFVAAEEAEVHEGRFTKADPLCTAELQWPWRGGYPESKHPLRLFVEAKLPGEPVKKVEP